MGKEIKFETTTTVVYITIEGLGGLDVPYLGYVETHLGIPEIKAFDNDVLLLIVPDSTYDAYFHHIGDASYRYGN